MILLNAHPDLAVIAMSSVLLIFICVFLYALISFPHVAKPIPQWEPIYSSDNIIKDYCEILELVRGAATKEELVYLTDEALDFEADHRSKMNVQEYFTDLMKEIHERYIQLTIKQRRITA